MKVSGAGQPVELKAVLISPDRELAAQLCRTLPETNAFQILADLKKYPNEQTLEIRLRQFQPDVVLLDVSSDIETACALIRRLSSIRPPVPVIGLDSASHPEVVMRVLKLGAREYLAAPFEPRLQRESVEGIVRLRRADPASTSDPGKVIAFSSAKPGCGASTLACQFAFALGRTERERVLLADLDLAAGTVGYYTARQSKGSFLEALEQSDPTELADPDPDRRGVDVLGAPAVPSELPFDPVRFRQTLDLFRCRYGWTVLDLPTVFHRVSLLALASADRTFLVTTAELASLHLARKAVRFLSQLGINRDRFEVVINQTCRRDGIQGQELEKILGAPVRILMPDDHARLHRAIALGEPVAPDSVFGEEIQQLAGSMADHFGTEKRKVEFMLGAGPVFAGI